MGKDTKEPLLHENVNEEPEKPSLSRRALVLVLFVALTFAATLEKVALKKAADSLPNFGIFLSQLIVLVFALIFCGVVFYKLKRTDDISESTRAFPKYKFAWISIFDTVAGVLILVPAGHVNGDLMTLLLQGVVPFAMLGSVLILKRKFPLLQYAGAAVVLTGIVVNTIPAFSSGANLADNVWYIAPLFLSCIPAALSGICQEYVLQGMDMDIYYYQCFVAISQFLLGLVILPLSFLLQSPGVPMSTLPDSMYQGLMCWLPGVEHPDPACSDAFSSVCLYLGLCVCFNILISLVVKHGGAVTMMIALTMAVPLQYLVFSVHVPYFVPEPTPVKALNYVGLVVTLAGLVLYHWAEGRAQPEEEGEEPQRTFSRAASASPLLNPFPTRSPQAGMRTPSRRTPGSTPRSDRASAERPSLRTKSDTRRTALEAPV